MLRLFELTYDFRAKKNSDPTCTIQKIKAKYSHKNYVVHKNDCKVIRRAMNVKLLSRLIEVTSYNK